MEKIQKLAEIIVNHSLKIKKNDRVLITYQGIESIDLVKALVMEIIKHKAVVDAEYTNQNIDNYIRENLTDEIIKSKTNKIKYQVDN